MSADITLVNLNMLFMRYGEEVERELHVPLGPLYLTRALEDAGFAVDFRDYQCVDSDEPFDLDVFLDFLADPAPVIGLSCMANLLPFTILAMQALKERYPDRNARPRRRRHQGGRGEGPRAASPWIDVICRGEGERTGPELLRALQPRRRSGGGRAASRYRDRTARIVHNARPRPHQRPRRIPFPAFEKVDLKRYAGYGMMTSRGCPYPCTFCSVAPVWNLRKLLAAARRTSSRKWSCCTARRAWTCSCSRTSFSSPGKRQVMAVLPTSWTRSGLKVEWKAFGRVNLIDEEMMRAMAGGGCVELRFGIESGSDRVLQRDQEGLHRRAVRWRWCPKAVPHLPAGGRVLRLGIPVRDDGGLQPVALPDGLVPHDGRADPAEPAFAAAADGGLPRSGRRRRRWNSAPICCRSSSSPATRSCRGGRIELPERYRRYFELITGQSRTSSPASSTSTWRATCCPSCELLRQFGFYPLPEPSEATAESCGAHSPRIEPQELATRMRGSGSVRHGVPDLRLITPGLITLARNASEGALHNGLPSLLPRLHFGLVCDASGYHSGPPARRPYSTVTLLARLPRLVDVAAPGDGDVIGQQLQRNDGDDRLQELGHGRHLDHVVGQAGHLRVAFADHGDHRPAAGLDLLQGSPSPCRTPCPCGMQEHAGRRLSTRAIGPCFISAAG